MRFYRAPNKRLIARAGSGRFRTTTMADIGLGVCEVCGAIVSPDWSKLGDGLVDPAVVNRMQRRCAEHLDTELPEGKPT